MRWLTRFKITLRTLFNHRQAETELDAELRDHLELEIQSNIRAGMSPEEANFAAQRLVGPISVYKEECRDARGSNYIETALRDLRYAIRMLGRTPLFTAVAMVTLAIGIGANTTVFTFVENILLRSLAIRDPQQVDSVNWGGIADISYPNYVDLRDRNTTFSSLIAYHLSAANIGIQPQNSFRAWGYAATGNYFETIGIEPLLGRFFGPNDDDKAGSHPVVVLSYRCWQSRFAGDPRVIGARVKISGYPFTVIGVAKPGFNGTELVVSGDYWVPMSMVPRLEPDSDWRQWRTAQNTWILGRRKDGVTRAQAEANLDQIGAQLGKEFPDDLDGKLKFKLCRPGLLGQDLRGPITSFGAVLMGVAGLGLLLACVNLAGMLLARASDRRREVGIRLALGASRSQLLRQLMTESLLLAMTGALVGFALAYGACNLLTSWQPNFDLPVNIALQPNPLVLCFTMAVAIFTTLAFGLMPALQATRVDLIPSLKNEPVSTRFRRWSTRDFLVTGQIALSVVLVICSVLVVRSLQHALTLQLGFNPDNAASVSFDLSLKGYDEERIRQFDSLLQAKASAIPGIQAAGIISTLPLRSAGADSEIIWRAEQPLPEPAQRKIGMFYNISPGYLRAAGTKLLAGRDIDEHDRHESSPVAIVNEAFAHTLFGDENALGRHVRISSVKDALEIVGIVEGGKYRSLGEDRQPAVFVPLQQSVIRWTTLVVRSPLPGDTATALLRKSVLEMDPEITLFNGGSLKEQLALPLFPARMAAIVLGIFGAFAMALAATGLFALMSYAVARRTREIGIRIALGAKRGQVLSSVMGRALLLCATGIVIGAVATLAAGRLLSAVLYGVSPRDPATYGAALLMMVGVALLACWTPAARAIRTDPVRALRED